MKPGGVNPSRLVIVGGGAAGYFAAIRARTLCPALEVVLLEARSKPLGKVKISGGGRCNVTHACFDPGRLVQSYPRGARELRGVFARFGPADTVQWFQSHGVRIKTEPDGRMFPVTDDAQTIIDCLVNAARSLGVEVHLQQAVKRCEPGFTACTEGMTWPADYLLLTTGSTATGYACATSLGHTLIEPVPSLFTFRIQDSRLEGLAGISVPAVAGRLQVGEEPAITQEGDLLITHWGLSGPVILRLSAWGARPLHGAGYRGEVIVDFFPAARQDELRAALHEQKQATPKRHVGNEMPDFDGGRAMERRRHPEADPAPVASRLPRRLWQSLLPAAGIPPETPWAQVPRPALNRLAEALKRTTFAITGKGVFKEEFVTAGGVPLPEVDFRTMESRVRPNLFLAGEILDVDALTGGFNFQNAWSTGWIAGESIALREIEQRAHVRP